MLPSLRRIGREGWSLASELWGDGRGWILVVVSLGWLLGLGVRLVFPALLPHIRAEFGLTLSAAGALITVLWAAYAVMQFPGGVFADRLGERAVLAGSTAVTAAGVVALVLAPSAAVFYGATALVGLGVGLFGTTRVTVLSDVYGARSGTAIGINQAAGNVGTAALPTLAGGLAVYVGWRAGFGVLVPAFVGASAGIWVMVPRRTSGGESAVDTVSLESLRWIVDGAIRPAVVRITAAMILMSFVYQSFTGFYPTYLVAEKGLAPSTAASLLGLFFASAIVLQPLAGAGSDRFGARPTLAAAIGTATLALLLLPFTGGLAQLVAQTIALSGLLAFWPIGNSYAVRAIPTDVQGATFGLIRTTYLLLATTGPLVVGALGDVGLFDGAFLLLAGVSALVLLVCLTLPA